LAACAIFEVSRVLCKGLKETDNKPAGVLVYIAAVLSALLLAAVVFFGETALAAGTVAGIILVVGAGLLSGACDFKQYIYSIFAFLYPGLFFAYLFLIIQVEHQTARLFALLANIAIVSATDMFAYYTGMLFGKTPLCPNISKKKTIEGAAGGWLFGILAGFGVGLIGIKAGLPINIWHYVILGLICGFFSQFGDLIASVVKRNAGIKDYAGILPGMGGIMDRLDGLIFCSPIVYYYFTVILGF
ncbi:MAG TPA: phosphatidate cytidylyltransferase, partial [Clostridia bacterium]|nr:phosphatidate cytidylyltransferase [Clostridia bacterium]